MVKQFVILMIVFGLLVTACQPDLSGISPAFIAPSDPTDLPVYFPIPMEDASQKIQSAPSIAYWVMPGLPGDVWHTPEAGQGFLKAQEKIDNAMIIGLTEDIPPGYEVLAQSEWVYVLVAPFKTVRDQVSQMELMNLWQGTSGGSLLGVEKLVIHEGDFRALSTLLGSCDGQNCKNVDIIPDDYSHLAQWISPVNWGIVPFHQLQPDYKVIALDGISPLDKDFDSNEYPLVAQFVLASPALESDQMTSHQWEILSKAFQKSNQDASLMTNLVMTGVTALVRATAYRMEVNGVTYPGEAIEPWLAQADITHISNEVSFYEDCPEPDPYDASLNFCSQPEYSALFKYIGADVIELTGNHVNDANKIFGVDSFSATLDLYENMGLKYYGGGRDSSAARQPLILEHASNHLAFLGCNLAGPDFAWATAQKGGAANCEDFAWMIEEIACLSAQGILPVVSVQYYEDYTLFPNTKMQEDFRSLSEAGAVIVNGSQAHRPKGLEFWIGSLVHYGLGNLFFDQMNTVINDVAVPQTRWEIIQRHIFYDGRYLSTELLTAMLEDYAQPRPATYEERQMILTELFSF